MRHDFPFPPLTAAQKATLAGVALRLFLYTVVIAGFMLLLLRIVRNEGGDVFSEGHPVEVVQMLLMLASAAMFLLVARLQSALDVLAHVLALFCLFAAIREGDSFWDHLMVWGWQLPATLVMLVAVMRYARQRAGFHHQLAHFMTLRAMTLLWAGFMLAIPVAQLLAHGPLFKLLMGHDYASSFKRLIEETLELVGYLMIFFSSIELFYQSGCWRILRDGRD